MLSFSKTITAVCKIFWKEEVIKTMTRVYNLGEEFTIKFVSDFCNVECSVDDTMAFILFLSSVVHGGLQRLAVHM